MQGKIYTTRWFSLTGFGMELFLLSLFYTLAAVWFSSPFVKAFFGGGALLSVVQGLKYLFWGGKYFPPKLREAASDHNHQQSAVESLESLNH
jgi:hypothetical protein